MEKMGGGIYRAWFDGDGYEYSPNCGIIYKAQQTPSDMFISQNILFQR